MYSESTQSIASIAGCVKVLEVALVLQPPVVVASFLNGVMHGSATMPTSCRVPGVRVMEDSSVPG